MARLINNQMITRSALCSLLLDFWERDANPKQSSTQGPHVGLITMSTRHSTRDEECNVTANDFANPTSFSHSPHPSISSHSTLQGSHHAAP